MAEQERASVLVRGVGDVGSAVAAVLFRTRYRVALHDEPAPATPRRGMAFTDAVFDGVAVLVVLLYPRTPIARLVGSDIAHAVPLTLIAGVGHWLLGSVDWVLLGSLVIGSLPGIFFGSHLSARVPDKILRPVLATILVIVGVRMLRA